MPGKWDMDRKPTVWERIYGSAFSIVIFSLVAAFTYASSIPLWSSKEVTLANLITFIVAVLLLVGSGFLLSRVLFGAAKKPSRKSILVTGYIICGMSVVLLVMAVTGFGNPYYLIGAGLTGIAGSISLIRQGKGLGCS